MSPGGNGHGETVDVVQLHSDVRTLFAAQRDLDAHLAAHDEGFGRITSEMAGINRAALTAANEAIATRQNVDAWRLAAADAHQDLSTRVYDLEHPARRRDDPRPPLPTNPDLLSPSKLNALDPEMVMMMRDLHATKERLAASEAALATRERHSDRVAAAEKTDAEAELERLRISTDAQIKTWKVIAGVAAAALATLGSIAAAYFAARGG